MRSHESSPKDQGLSKSRGIRNRRLGGILVSISIEIPLNAICIELTAPAVYSPDRSRQPFGQLIQDGTLVTVEENYL